jgi:hypothetical protein
MPIQFKFTPEKLIHNTLQNIFVWMRKSTDELLIEINRLSPIDTWTFQKQNRKLPVRIEWNKVIWTIINEWNYSERVETWFRQNPVNWHLENWEIFNNIWANTFQRALRRKKANILYNLKWL